MSGTEILTLRKAAEVAKVSHVTVREWCEKHGIGELQEDGRWHIRRADLNRVVRARAILGR